MPIERILLLEDDPILRSNLAEMLRKSSYQVTTADALSVALRSMANESFDAIIADVQLRDGVGTEILRQLAPKPGGPMVIMISGQASVDLALECMKLGAFDYLIKPINPIQLQICLKRASDVAQLITVNRFLSTSTPEDEPCELIGQSPAMTALRSTLRKVAPTDATVLIQGESGTGKELVARMLFRESLRSNAPYIKVNCAAIPETLIESEFFGHEKGSFTGANAQRIGRFELANKGTILLDEVSEVSMSLQAKLLRVLQEREFERLGGKHTISVDVRVIATTNRNLEDSIARREFREDLFFRLNVVPIHLPSLRDRISDVPAIAESFVTRNARRLGVPTPVIASESMDLLMNHTWPGNVRELENVLQRAMIFAAQEETLLPSHLSMPRSKSAGVTLAGPARETTVSVMESAQIAPLSQLESLPTLDQLEKDLIFAALKRCNNNRTHAARMIGISLRTLRNKLADYRKAGYREAMITRDLEDAVTEAA